MPNEWVSGNIFIRPNRLMKGEICGGHSHNFDHTTIIFTGAVKVVKSRPVVNKDGSAVINNQNEPVFLVIAEKDFEAPSHFMIEANAIHEITALRDDTVFWCVYSHRNPQGKVIQEYTGWYDAYV